MPTPDRTTIKAAIDAFVSRLGTNLVADPPTAGAPFRKVALGVGDPENHPRPFLTVRLVRARSVDVVDDDKLIEVIVELRLVTDVLGADPLTPLLDRIRQDDFLDGRRRGVVEARRIRRSSLTFAEPRSTARDWQRGHAGVHCEGATKSEPGAGSQQSQSPAPRHGTAKIMQTLIALLYFHCVLVSLCLEVHQNRNLQ